MLDKADFVAQVELLGLAAHFMTEARYNEGTSLPLGSAMQRQRPGEGRMDGAGSRPGVALRLAAGAPEQADGYPQPPQGVIGSAGQKPGAS